MSFKTIDFLKKQHFSMFDEKRHQNVNEVSSIFQNFMKKQTVDTADKSVLLGKLYIDYVNRFTPEIYDRELIVGTDWHWAYRCHDRAVHFPKNAGHFIPDYCDFLEKGIVGKLAEFSKDPSSLSKAKYLAMKAFSLYIKRYAEKAKELKMQDIAQICDNICVNPPKSFREALQLVWFAHAFLELESGNSAISFGRADIYLYPFYKNDIESGTITDDEALELIMAFYIKVCEGDESAMLTLGGVGESDLTCLFLKAQAYLNMRQPSLSFRICDTTSEKTMKCAQELTLAGGGMPAYFNDDAVITGLKALGYGDKSENYGIVGCYEAIPVPCFSNTVAFAYNLYESLNSFVRIDSEYRSFEEFLEAYKAYFERYYSTDILPVLRRNAKVDLDNPSPFLDSLLDRSRDFVFGIDFLCFGILSDSIYTVKKIVFDYKMATLSDLLGEADSDFADHSFYSKILALKDGYGSNSEESNRIAADLSEFIGKIVQKYPIAKGIVASAALFWFSADILFRNNNASLNGRRKGELLSYGVMPPATPHNNSLLSVLSSCANVRTEYFPNGCPTMITLGEEDSKRYLPTLLKSYFDMGGWHLAVNTVSAELLEEAKRNPADHHSLMVKISGYSTNFTGLDENMQNAVIERAKK